MAGDTPRRKYELRRRAESMQETRRRITEATVELHGTVGPARTTISLIAERAEVQRHTVYRHFPTEEDLLTACSAHYWDRHPWPDRPGSAGARDPGERTAAAFDALAAFYAENEQMLHNVLRDADQLASVASQVAAYSLYLDELAEELTDAHVGCSQDENRAFVRGVVRHAVEFSTWQSLARNGIGRAEAVDLLGGMVRDAACRVPATMDAGREASSGAGIRPM